MDNSLEPPWRLIHTFLLQIGEQPGPEAFWDAALRELRTLVPFDSAHVVFRKPGGLLAGMRSIDLPEPSVRSYPTFWNRLHANAFHRTRLHHDPRVFFTTSRPFVATEFGQSWVRPLRFEFSAGISIDDPAEGRPLQLITYRTRSRIGFTPLELQILGLFQPLLKNLYSLQCRAQAPRADIEAKVRDFPCLTKREKEIALSLCLGHSTQETSTRLFISPATTYRHVSNIFQKLGVSSRQSLVAKLLFLSPEDGHAPR